MLPLRKRLVGQVTATASYDHTYELPKAGWLAELYIHLNISLTTTAGSITVADSTFGSIPLITGLSFLLDGARAPLSLNSEAGKFLDIWSHIDQPGSERVALTGTSSGSRFDAMLRYPLAQSEGNLTGAVRLSDFASARLVVTTGALSRIGSGTGLALSGTIDVYAITYDETFPIVPDNSVIHTLTNIVSAVSSTGVQQFKLPKGQLAQRIVVVAENNSVIGDWSIVNSVLFRPGPGHEPIKLNTFPFRAEQAFRYGSDDVPIAGVFTFDFRRGDPNLLMVPMGTVGVAPEPELEIDVTGSLTNAKFHIILEQLARYGAPAAARAA